MSEPRVFIVQDSPGRNYVDASRYGTVQEPLLPATANLFLTTRPVIRTLRDKLRNFTDDDFLLLVGDPNIIGLACAIAASTNVGKYKTLKWDRDSRRYYAASCDIHDRPVQPKESEE